MLVDAQALGFSIAPDEAKDLAETGLKITRAADEQLGFRHPELPEWSHISFCQFAAPLACVDGVRRGQERRGDPPRQDRPLALRHRLFGAPCGAAREARAEDRRSLHRPLDHRLGVPLPHRSRSARRRQGRRSCRRSPAARGSPGRTSTCSIRTIRGRPATACPTPGRCTGPEPAAHGLAGRIRRRNDMATHSIEVIDSHTGGEPTRVVIAGGPDLGTGPLAERRERSGASSTASAPPSSTSRAARTSSSARCSSRRRTRRARPASSSSTTSATSACAATARSASWPRSRTWAGSSPATHRIETPVGDRHRDAASGRRGLGRQRRQLAHAEGGHRGRARPRRGHRRRRLGRQLVLPGRGPRAGSGAGQCGHG